MRVAIGKCSLELRQGDIASEQVDLIVNAANSQLAGGGGVDGAIHRRGGPTIMRETNERYPSGCPTGSAVISAAGNLSARFVAHAVGPVWHGGVLGEPRLLASALRRALELAVEHDCRSIAMPALSTGIYGYPMAEAAQVSIRAVAEFLRDQQQPELVRFVLFGPEALAVFSATLSQMSLGESQESG